MENNEKRKVVISLSVEMLMEFSPDFDEGNIDFYLNGSSACCGNFISQLADEYKMEGCFCDRVEGSYVREATPDDLKYYAKWEGAEKKALEDHKIYKQIHNELKEYLSGKNADIEYITKMVDELDFWRQQL